MKIPWFTGRKAARPPASCASLAWLAPVGSEQTPRGYEGQTRAGYVHNPIAQRAVRLVAEAVASAHLVVTPDDHDWAGLLRRPSPNRSMVDLMEMVASHILLHGNAYLVVEQDSAARPSAIHELRPERVTVETTGDGWPCTYVYRAGMNVARFAADDVLHLRSFHPLDDHFGLGCLEAASPSIAVHNIATRWNRSLLDNAARPSGALVFDGDGALSGEQFSRLRAELEEAYQGAANAGRPMLLEGGLRWQSLSLTPAELDFAATKESAAREIALAFGVPPMLLGLPGDNTYANYAEANRALWRLTVLPLAEKIASGLAHWLSRWGQDIAITIDRDAVPALADDRERLWRRVNDADFLSSDEKRQILGFPVRGDNP